MSKTSLADRIRAMLPIAAPVAVAATSGAADAVQLGAHLTGVGVGLGTFAIVSLYSALSGVRHEKCAEELKDFVELLTRQQGDWRRGLEKLLIAKGVSLARLPEEARTNPLAQLYQLLTAEHDTVHLLLTEQRDTQLKIARAVEKLPSNVLAALGLQPAALSELSASIRALRTELPVLGESLARIEEQHLLRSRLRLLGPSRNDERHLSTNPFLYSEELVPMLGRQKEFEDLRDFQHNSRGATWWLWTGDAGMGKSRLAHELCLSARIEGWDAGFLDRECVLGTTGPTSDWAERIIDKPTLIIVDYASLAPATLGHALAKLSRRAETDNLTVRVLLLERASRGPWHDALIRGTQSGDDVSLERFQYRDPIGLSTLDDEFLVELIHRSLQHGCTDAPTVTPPAEELLPLLGRFDRQRRPLYAAVLAEAIRIAGLPAVRTWEGDELLKWVLSREHNRWSNTVLGSRGNKMDEAHVNILTLATIIGATPAPRGSSWSGAAHRCEVHLPKPQSARPHGDQVDLTLCEQLQGFASSQMEPGTLVPALAPDLLGERFVLDRLSGALSLPGSLATTVTDQTRDILAACWIADDVATAHFCARAASDFPTHPSAQELWKKPIGSTEAEISRWAQFVGTTLIEAMLSKGYLSQCEILIDQLRRAMSMYPTYAVIPTSICNAYIRCSAYAHDFGHPVIALAAAIQGVLASHRYLARTATVNETLLNLLGNAALAIGDSHGALAAYQEADELVSKRAGSDSAERGTTLNNVGSALKLLDRLDEGIQAQAEAVARGLANPDVAGNMIAAWMSNWAAGMRDKAQVLFFKGDREQAMILLDESLRLFRRAEELDRRAFGPVHPNVARRLNHIGHALQMKADMDGALVAHREAERILRATVGNDHPDLSQALSNLSVVLMLKGDDQNARAHAIEAFRIIIRARGPRGNGVGTCGTNLFMFREDPVAIARDIGGDEFAVAFRSTLTEEFGKQMGRLPPELLAAIKNSSEMPTQGVDHRPDVESRPGLI